MIPELITRAQQGDESAFETIYEQQRRRVFMACLKVTGRRETAEEACQDTVLKVFQKLKSYRGEAQFSTWVWRIAINEARMAMRKCKRHVDVVPIAEMEVSDQRVRLPSPYFNTRDLQLEGVVDRVTIDRALKEVPAGFRLHFVMKEIVGLQHDEIAKLTGCHVGNSKCQLHRAKRRLRHLLKFRFSAPKHSLKREPSSPMKSMLTKFGLVLLLRLNGERKVKFIVQSQNVVEQ